MSTPRTDPNSTRPASTSSSTSGKMYWRNAQGVTLRELEQAEINAATNPTKHPTLSHHPDGDDTI